MCQPPTTDWKTVHDQLCRVAKERAALEHEEAGWLIAGLRSEVHRHLGFGSYAEYLERLFGYQPREVRERLRVARALEALPETSQALASGKICWSATRELTRVANPDTERAWLDAGADQSVRQLEKMVSGREPGDMPYTPADERVRKHVLRFEVNAETYALWREAVGVLRAEAGAPLDEDDALLMMARQILAGPDDDGRASYQVAVTVCDGCGQGWQQGRGEQLAVGAEVVEMAHCDAQHLPAAHVGRSPRPKAKQNVPPATRREVLRRDGGRCVVPGCRAAVFVDIHHLELRSEGRSHAPERLVTLCGAHHRALHRGSIIIEGNVGDGLRFLHADGSRYGTRRGNDRAAPEPHTIEVSRTVFAGLRHAGFKETAARRALSRAMTHVGHEASVEQLMRAALHCST